MKYISEKEIRESVSMKDVIEAVKTAFSMTERGLIDATTGYALAMLDGLIPGRENDNEIIVFETVGIAGQDLLTSALIYDKLMCRCFWLYNSRWPYGS